jgi:Zn ribbon nucleic-acid-binding protein
MAHVCRFEDLPLGWLRGSVILSCVDSRATRQAINAAACALGCAWIDAALAREGSVRARAHLPRRACLECGWGQSDYELTEQRLPCESAQGAPTSTDAAAELGAIAAGLQVGLLRRLAANDSDSAELGDRQWFYDLPSGRGWTAHYASNPACRLNHAPWDVTLVRNGTLAAPLGELLALGERGQTVPALTVPGKAFVRRLRCPHCGRQSRVRWRVTGRIGVRPCGECGAPMRAAGVDLHDALSARNTPDVVLREPLARRGFVAGDIVALVADGTPRHFQLA